VGIVNMLTFARSTSGTLQQILDAEFGSIKTDRKFLREISPITVVQQMKDPLFVYQGQNDPRVPRSEQDQLVTALRKQQTPVEYMVAADEGHSLAQKRTKLQFLSRSMRFLEQHLDLPGPPKDCQKAASAGEGEAAAEEEASPKSK
jgi:dipeptidyl aminopeptidase/acylaminoacyl peptidase